MGGRDQVRKHHELVPDRELWIQEVSDSRLSTYERMISSSRKVHRADGSFRDSNQRAYFADLISRERARRSK